MRERFKTYDASAHKAPTWLAKFLEDAFKNPKTQPMWDARKEDQRQRLEALATGIKQFLAQLPDGEEIGTSELAKGLHPEQWDNEHLRKFIIGRIERIRYANMIDGFFRTLPDKRWKTPRTFYKYHNGKVKADE